MKGKGNALWVAGVGFSLTQIYFYLTSTWQKFTFVTVCFICLYIFCKLPKELHLLFWVTATLITSILYYTLKPEPQMAMESSNCIKYFIP